MKKMLAPVVITVIVVIYYLVYFGVLISMVNSAWKWLLGIIPAFCAAAMIYVCIQRIHEIRSGEEDDLSQY